MHGEQAESLQRLLGAAQHRIRVTLRLVVGRQQDQFLRTDLPREEVQQLERRRISPLQVLEDDEQRLLRGQAAEELSEVPQQPRLYLGWIAAGTPALAIGCPAQIGKEVPEVRRRAAGENGERRRIHLLYHRKQRVREERVGDTGLHGVRAANRYVPSPFRGALRRCGGEARLADAAFADDENGPSGSLRR